MQSLSLSMRSLVGLRSKELHGGCGMWFRKIRYSVSNIHHKYWFPSLSDSNLRSLETNNKWRIDYKEAARIRDSLKLFEDDEEPVLRLRRLLKEAAIADERFQDAAGYRDELKRISPHSLLKCSSDATTLGVRVQVRSVYIEGRSQPSKGLYFFAYRIRITNDSDDTVQLLRRHWIITDANGRAENVWGMGVIGEQPVLLPKTSFEYSSACPLSTPNGRTEGDFEMIHVDKVGSRSFNVAIAPFCLSILGDDECHII